MHTYSIHTSSGLDKCAFPSDVLFILLGDMKVKFCPNDLFPFYCTGRDCLSIQG